MGDILAHVRLPALALAVLLAAPLADAGTTQAPRAGRPKKKPEKKPKPLDRTVDPPPAAPCPDGKPTAAEVDAYVAGGAAEATKVKAYAATCRAFAGELARDLYLRGYTLKEDRPDQAMDLFKKSIEVAPRDCESADKARVLLAKLQKSRRD